MQQKGKGKRERQASHLGRESSVRVSPLGPRGVPAPWGQPWEHASEKKPTAPSLPPPEVPPFSSCSACLSPRSGSIFQPLFFCGRVHPVLSRTKKVSAWFSPSTPSYITRPPRRRNRPYTGTSRPLDDLVITIPSIPRGATTQNSETTKRIASDLPQLLLLPPSKPSGPSPVARFQPIHPPEASSPSLSCNAGYHSFNGRQPSLDRPPRHRLRVGPPQANSSHTVHHS